MALRDITSEVGPLPHQPSDTDRRRRLRLRLQFSSDDYDYDFDFDFVEAADELINYRPSRQQLYPTATLEELESFWEDISGHYRDVNVEEEEEFVRVDCGDSRDGLSEEVIRRNLKSRMRYQREEDVEEICVVCQCEYKFRENVVRLECGHEYHVECMEKWLLQKNMCPVCKRHAISPMSEEFDSDDECEYDFVHDHASI